ncbi:MAG: hypothetical protein RXN95_01995 [Hydrogenobaculum sp.]
MKKFLLSLAFLCSISYGGNLDSFLQKLNKETYQVINVKNNEVYIAGKNLHVGEVLDIKEQTGRVINPLSHQFLGYSYKEVAKVKIEKVYDNFAVGNIISGKKPSVGDIAKIDTSDICFKGSDEKLYDIAAIFPNVKSGENCALTIREFPKGYGIAFSGVPGGFIKKSIYEASSQGVVIKKASIRDLHLLVTSKFIKSVGSLVLSADVGDLYGNGKEYLVLLTRDNLLIYQLLRDDIVKIADMSLPAGHPISVSVGRIGQGKEDYILVNMFTGSNMSSFIVKMVGDSPVIVAKHIHYFMSILDKKHPHKTFWGQTFTADRKFGAVKQLAFENGEVKAVQNVDVPAGFRIDGASLYKGDTIFIDSSHRLRVFKNDTELYSSSAVFGGSYAYVNIPFINDTTMKYIFYEKGTPSKLEGLPVFLIGANKESSIEKFFGITKYAYGNLYALDIGGKDNELVYMKKLRGASFEEAIEGIISTKEGIFVITGKVGTIPIQNNSDIYKISFKVL